MRLIVLAMMAVIIGLGLAAAMVALPVMAEKGPLRATLVAHLGGGQEEVPGGGAPDGRGRAVVKVFKEQLCAKVKTGAIESSSKATINLGMSGERGPTVANFEEERAARPTTGTTATRDTTATTGTTADTTTPTTGTTTTTTGTTGAQTGTTTTTGDTTLAQPATTPQATTVPQATTTSQSTASPTASASASATASASTASASTASASTASASASASASAFAASTSRATTLEHTGGCVEVPRALSLELLEHPGWFYVNVTNGQSAEGAIRGQLHRSGHDHHRSGDGDDD
jgi:hypothetical protein